MTHLSNPTTELSTTSQSKSQQFSAYCFIIVNIVSFYKFLWFNLENVIDVVTLYDSVKSILYKYMYIQEGRNVYIECMGEKRLLLYVWL